MLRYFENFMFYKIYLIISLVRNSIRDNNKIIKNSKKRNILEIRKKKFNQTILWKSFFSNLSNPKLVCESKNRRQILLTLLYISWRILTIMMSKKKKKSIAIIIIFSACKNIFLDFKHILGLSFAASVP